MLCQHCKKRMATEHYVETFFGKTQSFHYCSECYQTLFGQLKSQASNDVWSDLFAEVTRPEKQCPVCGTTFADYKNTGLLGCASCYDVFKSELLPSIKRIQGKDRHVGKVGKDYSEHELMRELQSLQERLEKALKNKCYGEAGKLNERMNKITKILYGDKSDG